VSVESQYGAAKPDGLEGWCLLSDGRMAKYSHNHSAQSQLQSRCGPCLDLPPSIRICMAGGDPVATTAWQVVA
jgi:hypothetical protein